jgi:hypothetical protein
MPEPWEADMDIRYTGKNEIRCQITVTLQGLGTFKATGRGSDREKARRNAVRTLSEKVRAGQRKSGK